MEAKFTAGIGSARSITVGLPHQMFSIEQVAKITANLMGKLGHVGCFSGFDIRFVHDDDYRVNGANLEVGAVSRGG